MCSSPYQALIVDKRLVLVDVEVLQVRVRDPDSIYKPQGDTTRRVLPPTDHQIAKKRLTCKDPCLHTSSAYKRIDSGYGYSAHCSPKLGKREGLSRRAYQQSGLGTVFSVRWSSVRRGYAWQADMTESRLYKVSHLGWRFCVQVFWKAVRIRTHSPARRKLYSSFRTRPAPM